MKNFTNETTREFEFSWAGFIINDVMLILAFIAFVGSALIIGVVVKYPSLRKREDFNPIIGYLAIADGSTSIGVIVVQSHWCWRAFYRIATYTRLQCMPPFIFWLFGVYASQLMIVVIGLDRLKAIRNPLKYISKDHTKSAKRTFIGIFLFSIGSSIVVFFDVDMNAQPIDCTMTASWSDAYQGYFFLFNIVIQFIVMVIYCMMLIGMRKKTKNTVTLSISNEQAQSEFQMEMQNKVNKAVNMIMGLYCVLWVFPTYLTTFVVAAGFDKALVNMISYSVAIGLTASAAANIFVYANRIPSFRLYLGKLYKGEADSG